VPTLAIDLDGVLAQYSGKDHAETEIIGEPVPGAVEFVHAVVNLGWQVVVHSRNHRPALVNEWLIAHGLGDCVGTAVMPPDATVYLDDRAVRFEGEFAPVLAFLQGDPRPWWRRGK